MRVLSRKLDKDGIYKTIIRGEFSITDVVGVYEESSILDPKKVYLEIVEHDVQRVKVPTPYPYGDSIPRLKKSVDNYEYKFVAFVALNPLSHGICNQMQYLFADEKFVVKVFNNTDEASEWIEQMRYSVE